MTNETYDFGIAIPYDSDQDRILSEKKYGVKIQQIIKPCTSEYCKKKGHHLHDADCTLRVIGSHDAILAFCKWRLGWHGRLCTASCKSCIIQDCSL